VKKGAGFGSGSDFALIEPSLTGSITLGSLPRTKAMLDVFRLAWFAVRTFFGAIALVLAMYAALWVFVRVLSAAPGAADPNGAPPRTMSFEARDTEQDRKAASLPKAQPSHPRIGHER